MIPYFTQPHLSLGPISIHLFGVLVATGILLGLRLMRWRAGQQGLDPVLSERMGLWAVVGGFIGAHIIDRLAYFPRETLEDPMSLLRFWESISSFGGFVGAIAALALFVRRSKLTVDKWRYLDLVAYALPVGWFFGRVGCFVAYDHPGLPTTFFLAQRYSDGVVRHNLGLEEAIYTLLVVLLFLWLGRKRERPAGFFVGLLAVVYAPVRFLLDFLRTADARYFALTPGQYGSVLMLLAGILVLVLALKGRRFDQPS